MFSNTFVIEKLTHVNRKVNSQDEKTITKANIPNNERANSFCGQCSLACCSPWGHKESNMIE